MTATLPEPEPGRRGRLEHAAVLTGGGVARVPACELTPESVPVLLSGGGVIFAPAAAAAEVLVSSLAREPVHGPFPRRVRAAVRDWAELSERVVRAGRSAATWERLLRMEPQPWHTLAAFDVLGDLFRRSAGHLLGDDSPHTRRAVAAAYLAMLNGVLGVGSGATAATIPIEADASPVLAELCELAGCPVVRAKVRAKATEYRRLIERPRRSGLLSRLLAWFRTG